MALARGVDHVRETLRSSSDEERLCPLSCGREGAPNFAARVVKVWPGKTEVAR